MASSNSNHESGTKRLKKTREATRVLNELTNPCIKESNMSLKCLDDNHYDKDKCTSYFHNYKNCVNFWAKVTRDRTRKGIKPFMPHPNDREEIKQEYYKKMTA